MKKRAVTFLLLAAMAVTMATGCSQGQDSSGSSSTASSGAASGATDDGSVPTITIADSGKSSQDMTYWPTDFVAKMEEDLGIKLEVVELSSEQFDLFLASGDANFDIANCTSYRESQVLNANLAVNLDDYLEEYGQNIAKYEDRNNLTREFLSNGTGNLYFKRIQTGPEIVGAESWGVYVVRWDWYKELGCPAMNNDDEYLSVLQQMVEAHPTNDAGGATYGLGQYVGTGLWSWTVTKGMQLGYVDLVAGLQLDLNDNTIHNAYTDDEASFWQAMEFFNKAYNMGLCDPDFFIMKSDDLTQKVVQGTYAGAIRTWDVADYYTQEYAKDPNTLKGYISVFPEEGGMSANYNSNPIAGWENNSYFVFSGSDNIEKAVSALDYFDNEDNMRAYYSGFEGTHWEYDENGVPHLTDAGKELFSSSGDAVDQAGFLNSTTGGWMNYLCGSSGGSLHSDGQPLNLTLSDEAISETLNPLQKDYSEYYGVDYPLQVHEKQVEEGIAIDRSNDPKDLYMVLTETPEEMATRKTQIETLLEGYIPDLVMAASEDEFNSIKAQVIEECKAAGSDELYEWAQGAYEDAAAKLEAAKEKYGIE